MKIVDGHCHIASLDFVPRSFAEGSLANVAARMSARGVPASVRSLWPIYEARMQDPLCDELVAEMDAAGIARAVLLAADFSYALRDCRLTVEESFARHAAVLRRHNGRFDVFGGVDPRWGRPGVELFERAIADFAFSGFKVYPPCGFSPSARELFPFYELCAEFRLPVLVHIGPSSPALSFDYTHPFLVDEAARTFPNVSFILAHGSVHFPDACALLCRFRPNVYLDISAFQVGMAWPGGTRTLRRLAAQDIAHKIVFGTDWPVFRLQGTQRDFVEAVFGARGALRRLPDADREGIAHGNLARVMQLRRDAPRTHAEPAV